MKSIYLIFFSLFFLVGCGRNSTTIESLDAVGENHPNLTVAETPIEVGAEEQFYAIANFDDDHWENISAETTWETNTLCPTDSSPGTAATAATVSATGLVTGVHSGLVYVVARARGFIGCFPLTVNGAALVSIDVTPEDPSQPAGISQAFTATGHYADGTTADITNTVVWGSSNGLIASISNVVGTKGVATGLTPGVVNITATRGSISGSTTFTVTAAIITSLDVTPTSASVWLGSTQQFTAIATYSDGTTVDVSATATWDSSNAGVATISASGLASTVSTGSATMSATYDGMSDSSDLTVIPVPLVSISVTPKNATIAKNGTRQYTATGTYADNSTADITTSVTWTTNSAATATISNAGGTQGLATGVAIGFVRFTARLGSVSGSTNATVTP